MKYYKKIIFFIFLFLSIVLLKNNCFATTVEYNNWEGAPEYAKIPALELSTTTESYVTLINNARSEIVVLEPYNYGDYIALSTATTSENGTYNRFSGYSTSTKKLTDIRTHKLTFNLENQSWSDWTSSTSSTVSAYAPNNSNYIYKTRNNIVLYVKSIGIIGNDVISSGVPLPEGIKFTDNIAIIHTYDRTRIYYTDNPENNFQISGSYSLSCKTASGSNASFKHYTYDTSSLSFGGATETSHVNTDANPACYYSTNNSIIVGKEGYACGDFFRSTPLMEIPEVETTIPTLETVEQIPEVMIQTVKIVIPVGLVIFGILLLISLIKLVIWRMT